MGGMVSNFSKLITYLHLAKHITVFMDIWVEKGASCKVSNRYCKRVFAIMYEVLEPIMFVPANSHYLYTFFLLNITFKDKKEK